MANPGEQPRRKQNLVNSVEYRRRTILIQKKITLSSRHLTEHLVKFPSARSYPKTPWLWRRRQTSPKLRTTRTWMKNQGKKSNQLHLSKLVKRESSVTLASRRSSSNVVLAGKLQYSATKSRVLFLSLCSKLFNCFTK